MEDDNLHKLQDRIERALSLVEKRQENIGRLQSEEEQRYEAIRRKHRRRMRGWAEQLDVLEVQQEQLTLGNGALHRGKVPKNLELVSDIVQEVLQAVAERQVNGTAISHEGRMRGFTNGHAQYDDEGHLLLSCTQSQEDDVEDDLVAKSAEPGMLDLQYASPESEDDMDEDKDGDEDDDEEDEEVEEDEKDVRPAPPSRGPQMVPRQVALRQQRPSGAAPPGFEPKEDAESPNAPVPPPGFEVKRVMRSPPGYSRAGNGVTRASPSKESRGAADMNVTDLRNLLSRKRDGPGSSSQLTRTPRTEGSEGEGPPAPAVPDAREIINQRKMTPQVLAPRRPTREWDDKEDMQDELPGERPPRPPRPEVPLYRPQPRERPMEAAGAPPGFSSDAELPSAPPVRISRVQSILSEDGFKAPSSPMVDPEDGARDRAYFGNGQAHSENASSSTLHDELFPSLGAAAKEADTESAAPQLRGAWGSGPIASRLAQAQKDPATMSSPAPGSVDIIAYEQRTGLRSKDDALPDKERRQQMRSKKDFVHEEDVRAPRRLGWTNLVEGLELHKNLLNAAEQEMFIQNITAWEAAGRRGELRGRTFSAPRKNMRGNGRVTIQFGCCYNYAVDFEGRSPGIIPEEVVEPMPDLLVALVKRLVRWGVLPARMAPDSAIINIYDKIDCIPPHIDHHDFSRPFCTISLLSEQKIMFGNKLVPESPGHFIGATCEPFHLPLPTGSCLVLKGNGADLAMHCVPPVSERRMSITLRRMGPQHADKVRAEVQRAAQRIQRLPQSWADDIVDDAPRRYGADVWEDADREDRLQRY